MFVLNKNMNMIMTIPLTDLFLPRSVTFVGSFAFSSKYLETN